MSYGQWIIVATKKLKAASIGTARLDALILLEDATGLDRSHLLADTDTKLTDEQLKLLNKYVKDRADHIPLAYIRGKTEFYGREFMVDKYVLEPRPESETMIELLKTLSLPKHPLIADIGSGSGALGITAGLELPGSVITLLDISKSALAVSARNAKLHGVNANILQNNLLSGLPNQYDVILANLPYVPDNYQINKAASYEPRMAIFGGPDGLELYRRLFAQISNLAAKPSFILAESIPFQHPALREIALRVGYLQQAEIDFIQLFTLQQTNA